jgi:hypothetical protein
VERRRRRRRRGGGGWDEPIARMDAERLVKMSRDDIPIGKRSPGLLKRSWADLIFD